MASNGTQAEAVWKQQGVIRHESNGASKNGALAQYLAHYSIQYTQLVQLLLIFLEINSGI